MRPTVLAALLTALVLLATLPAQASGQSGPAIGLSGFVLGSPGAAVRPLGRGCTPSQGEANGERCLVNDSTIVWLARDTIVGVVVVLQVPGRHRNPGREATDWWERGLRAYAEQLFGPPDNTAFFVTGTVSDSIRPTGFPPLIPMDREWDLMGNGQGIVAQWFRHSTARWDARVVLGRVFFFRPPLVGDRVRFREAEVVAPVALHEVQFGSDVNGGILSRAEVHVACAGRLFRPASRDSSGALAVVAPLGPTASCPPAP